MGSCSEHAHSLYASFRRLIKGQASSGDETKSSYGSTVNLTQENASSSRTLSSDYTELMGGSVPCPSCKGSGRIPKEMEETLVALIPVNDDRLKPKRTWAYVLCGILVCILLAGGAIFLMVPRAVDLSSVRPPIEIINVFDHDADHISFYFLNAINISNANYYSVRVVNSSATIISKFQPWSSDVVGEGGNASSTMVGPRSRNKHLLEFNNTVTLKGGVAEYCQAPFSRLTSLYVNMQFDISVTLEYLSHREQATISTVQQVCCVPSGNCTST
uniref:LEA_2 domain-containing protein n=2 Tax=Ascaris TaxID=6251 RepID=A0A0M3HWQ1_ASCLU